MRDNQNGSHIEHFVRELDSLRAHLGVARWHVFGHSWGTILAIEYYRAHPDRVASLTFGSACFDIPAYERRAKELLATLSKPSQLAVKKVEARLFPQPPSGLLYLTFEFGCEALSTLQKVRDLLLEEVYKEIE